MHSVVARASVTAFISACLLMISGCSSEGKPTKESAKAVEGLDTTRARVVKAKEQINATVAAMNQLSSGGNLKSNYQKFSSALSETESQAKRAQVRAQEMEKRSNQYIAQWEKEMSDVSSPELRAAAEQRRQRVRENFDEISAAAEKVREAYQPLIQDLRDINKTLSLDLTQAGLQSTRPAMDRANADARTLNQRLDELIAELDRVSSGMSPRGK